MKQICHVVNAVSPGQRMNAEDLAHYLASNRGAVLLLAHAGADVAGAATAAPAGRPGFQFTMVRVVPGQRRRGVGSALLEAARGHALELDLPRLWGRIDARDRGSLEFAHCRGLTETGRELISVIDPTGTSEMRPPPPGVTVVSLADRPDLIRGAYDAERECLPDVPVPTPMQATADEMLRVTCPGGTIALASWTPDGFIGRVFEIVAEFVPSAPGTPAVRVGYQGGLGRAAGHSDQLDPGQ